MEQTTDTILIIDDDPYVRDMLEKNLIVSGYRVLTASNGKKGLHLVNESHPLIVLLDLNMPEMDGIEFLKNLDPSYNKTRSIIVLTGFGTDDDIKTCYQLGIQSFLRKPVNWFELEGLIKNNLELLHFAERLKREIAQKEQLNLLLKATLDGMAEGTIALDRQFHIRVISRKACSILGINEADAVNKPASVVLGQKIGGTDGLLINTDKNAVITDITTELVTPSGRILPVSLTIKPLKNTQANLERLIFFRDLRAEQKLLLNNSGGIAFGSIISNTPRMREVFNLIETISISNATVLIQGDSGTGKELVAQEIHTRSNRASQKMHIVNCAAIPPNLLESEFFGHEKGAFTGAHKSTTGRFELADGGTLFLDEIAEIPIELQAKLLRALQEQAFEKVGGTETIRVDVRIIAATNSDLKKRVRKKLFREDLYYRLDVVKIQLPSLLERMPDIPLLVAHFIHLLNRREQRSVNDLSTEAYQMLFSYHWPGNIRELYHVIEHAFAVSKGAMLQREHLPEKLAEFQSSAESINRKPKSEKEAIQFALEKSSFHKGKAAALLGISYVTLYRKIKKYKISS